MQKASFGMAGLVAAFLAGVLLVLAQSVMGDPGVTPGSRAAKLDACVRSTPDMRRNHMKYLKHERDETVHKGIRERDLSLAGCVGCHAATDTLGQAVPVNVKGQFCQSCHEFAAVHIDCFGCHRNTPQQARPEFIPGFSENTPDSQRTFVSQHTLMNDVLADGQPLAMQNHDAASQGRAHD